MAPTSIDGNEITGATIDGQDVSEITVDGQTVFTAIPDSAARYDFSREDGTAPVADLSANGHDLTGSYSGVSESINGVQAGVFDGADDLLESTTPTASQANHVFVVAQCTNTGASSIQTAFDGAGERNLLRVVDGSNADVNSMFAGKFLTGEPADENAHIWTMLFNGANSVFRSDGADDATGDAGSRDLQGIALGAQGNDINYFTGRIGEVLVYTRQLSASEVGDVESYLSDKWGIAI